MSATIIATGSKTIIDLQDGKTLSAYLGANQPRTQIQDLNVAQNAFTPDWSSQNLVITPVVYVNSTFIDLSDTNLATTWKRRAGSGSEEDLIANTEVVSANVLTVNANVLSDIASGLVTYVARFAYRDPDTGLTINTTADISFSLVKTGQSARTAWISGEQVFKYSTDSTVTPSQITLTANLQGVTMQKWQYKNSSGNWVDYPTSSDNTSITTTTLIVKPDQTSVWNEDTATIRILTSVASVTDVISIYKIHDGSQGQKGDDASVVLLTNENITFAANTNGEVPATTATCNVVAYTGLTKVTPTVGTVTGAPTGMTVSHGTAMNNEIPLTITVAAGSTLGGATEQNGVLSVPITSPIVTTLQIHWSKVNTGATGDNAIVFTVYAPGGTTFVNREGTLSLDTQAYNGSTPIESGATYQWFKYEGGKFVGISGAISSSYTVSGSEVASTATFKCTMRYPDGGDKYYSDVITLVDKTDNYQAEIESTGGDIFKNTQGTSYLICRLWQNGAEVDTQKAVVFGTAPSDPSTGDMYYAHTSGQHTTKLMRYSGSAWVDVTSSDDYKQSKTYTWFRRNKDGEPMDNGQAFATGKVIYVDGSDVEIKTVFTCEVS